MRTSILAAALLTLSLPAFAEEDKKSRVYNVSVERAFMAAAQVVAKEWQVLHSDKDTGIVSFRTGRNMRTWTGFDMTVLCEPLEDGQTRVSVHAQRRSSDQLFSWKEGDRIASTLHKKLAEKLEARP